MANVGRNDPCPCGSGKKYKRCCAGKPPASPPPARPAPGLPGRPQAGSLKEPRREPTPRPPEVTVLPGGGLVIWDEDEVGELSDRAEDLIRAGRLDEAEEVCRQLAERYPGQIDSLHRYAALYEARGDLTKAALYARQAVDFARTHDGFDDDSVACYTEEAERIESAIQAAGMPPEPDGHPHP